jgi:hypothetical protein
MQLNDLVVLSNAAWQHNRVCCYGVYHREQKAASTLKAKAKLYQKLARGEVQGVEVGQHYTLYTQLL